MANLLTISQVALLSGKSRNTIVAWIDKGRISKTIEGNKVFVDAAEVARVFPYVTPQDIEFEINPHAKFRAAHGIKETPAPVQRVQSDVRFELEKLKAENAMLKKQIEILERERKMMAELIESDRQRFDILMHLLPAQSSARRSHAATQERDENGRFKGTGRGVQALLTE